MRCRRLKRNPGPGIDSEPLQWALAGETVVLG